MRRARRFSMYRAATGRMTCWTRWSCRANGSPRVYESPEITGRITAQAAQATGLAEGTPVVGGAGDQAAGAVGVGVVQAGRASVSVGTSGVVFAHLQQPQVDPQYRTHTFCHAVPRRVACDGRDVDGGRRAAVVSRDLRPRHAVRRAGGRGGGGSCGRGGAAVRAVFVGRAHAVPRPAGARGVCGADAGAHPRARHPRRAGRSRLRVARLAGDSAGDGRPAARVCA
jgi:sugar (pentulose or hexulose) kinase